MLRYKTETGLVRCTTSGQETERVNSYNPGARTGLESGVRVKIASFHCY